MTTLSAKLTKLKCSLHQEHNQSIAAVCLSENCNETKRTLCSFCLLYNHQGHQVIELTSLGNMIKEGLKKQNVLSFSSTCISEMRNCLKLITQKIQSLSLTFKEIKKRFKEQSSIELIYKQLFINSIKKEQELETIIYQLKLLFINNQFIQTPNYYQEQLFLQTKQLSLNTSFFLGSLILNQKLQFTEEQYSRATNCIRNINELFQPFNYNLQNDYSTIQSIQEIKVKYMDVSSQTDIFQYQNQPQLSQYLQWNLGLYLNFDENILISNGFVKIYEKLTLYPFTEELLDKLQTSCSENTILCIGGKKNNEKNKLLLCAIDFAQELFMTTNVSLQARKSQNTDIFWYHYKNRCFGFSKNEKISASNATADECQIQSEYRFCIWLDGDIGFRIGNNRNLKCSNEYSYVIFQKL
ncbi:unnamed protein product [Paramecium sonneborni]|uniref:Uncharacterized protein n=1 Tax=Paramecium sonneborni TaxID=65129 RepID=A0A8S1RJ55_9CILI|nr:unnamed protein product [Paramecium sonneborni]